MSWEDESYGLERPVESSTFDRNCKVRQCQDDHESRCIGKYLQVKVSCGMQHDADDAHRCAESHRAHQGLSSRNLYPNRSDKNMNDNGH